MPAAFIVFVMIAAVFGPAQEPARPPSPDIHYVPTSGGVTDAMLKLAKVTPEDVVYDLGSGDGRIVITAAKKYGARGVGIELDPELIKKANRNAQKAGVSDRVTFVQADLFKTDFSDATVVTLYLSNSINRRLASILQRQLKPGARDRVAPVRHGRRLETRGGRPPRRHARLPVDDQITRPKLRIKQALGRGLRKRCPHCGVGPLFSGWTHLASCSACGLVYERNSGDTWAFTIIGDRLPIAVIIVAVYFGLVRSHFVLGLIVIAVLGVIIIWTAPNRWGAGIALHYLSRVYWPDPADPIPSVFSPEDRTPS